MNHFVIVALATIVSFSSLAQAKIICDSSLLSQIKKEDRSPREEYSEDNVIILKESNLDQKDSRDLIEVLKNDKYVYPNTQKYNNSFLKNPKLLLTSYWNQTTVFSTANGCRGGELMTYTQYCEDDFVVNGAFCKESCHYINRAEDCIPD